MIKVERKSESVLAGAQRKRRNDSSRVEAFMAGTSGLIEIEWKGKSESVLAGAQRKRRNDSS
ncbi:MAG: hypothetical protein KDC13_08520 [Bacteroidetes bacterium]|nr:hypothetical protein [Bacteroidota bacterium]